MVPRQFDPELEMHRANGLRDKILILVLAALAGTGGTIAYRQINPPAPDRFTGTQAANLELRTLAKITGLQQRIQFLEKSQNRLLEVTDNVAAGVQRIEIKLARLPPDEWRERIRKLETEVLKHKNEAK